MLPVQKWRNKIKETMIDFCGGECCVCGYNKCRVALHFHHIDPSTKIDTVANMLKNPKSIKTILEEVQKCALLCANCHAEFHAGLIDPDAIKQEYDFSVIDIKEPTIKPVKECENCGKLTNNRKYCSKRCIGLGKFTVDWPEDPQEVLDKVKETSFYRAGIYYNCSDNAVRKYLKRHNLI